LSSPKPLPIVFLGTAELACASLRSLSGAAEYQIKAVVTQQDKPRGRDLQLQPTFVKAAALELGLPVLQPKRARDPAFIEEIRGLGPELMVVVAYGQILPQALLDVPKHGCLNVHTSLLPRHRGAAPIQWAILEGDEVTGVTIMKMDAGLDTGPMLSQRTTAIGSKDTSQTLHDRLASMGAELLLETIPGFLEGRIQPQVQGEGAIYARKIEKADGLVNWDEPAEVIWRKVRAFTPWPGAYTFFEVGGARRMLKIWEAEPVEAQGRPGETMAAQRGEWIVGCGRGALRLLIVQPEGGKRMTAQQYLSGRAAPQAFAR
jgi:methionyl-tRNA formyltransferase